jgi:hypothetical protein
MTFSAPCLQRCRTQLTIRHLHLSCSVVSFSPFSRNLLERTTGHRCGPNQLMAAQRRLQALADEAMRLTLTDLGRMRITPSCCVACYSRWLLRPAPCGCARWKKGFNNSVGRLAAADDEIARDDVLRWYRCREGRYMERRRRGGRCSCARSEQMQMARWKASKCI